MTALPRITTFAWVPIFARGFVRDLRPRWAFEEVGQAYEVDLIRDSKTPEHRRFQPFGQVPTYRDDEIEIFESGAIVLRIAERAGRLLPADPRQRMKAVQWVIAALNTVEPAVMEFAINELFEAGRSWSAERRPVVTGYIETRLRDLEARLGDGPWLEGDVFSVGDLMMVSVLGGLRGTGVLDRFPGLAAYVARGEGRPAHRKAMADHLAVFEGAAAD
ncbi:MAG TPA: glutathione S-transferase family protein [Aliidongia sp.]|nr:glutathione S-transferase family protein [Aliidongia sp.]